MNIKFFENLINQKILGISTVYLARVLSHNSNANKCNIQPLSLIKAVGGTAKRQTVIENVPISKVVLHALEGATLENQVVIVCCSERDISQTRKNIFALPSLRHHNKSDSIVIGYL